MRTVNMRYLYILFAILALSLPPLTDAAAPRTFRDLTDIALNIINSGIGVVLVLGIAVYFYGVATNLPGMNSKSEQVQVQFFWGILALFVMFSVWGILEVVQNTVFSGGSIGTGGSSSSSSFCSGFDVCE